MNSIRKSPESSLVIFYYSFEDKSEKFKQKTSDSLRSSENLKIVEEGKRAG